MALNKIDRLYEWKPNKHKDVRDVLGTPPEPRICSVSLGCVCIVSEGVIQNSPDYFPRKYIQYQLMSFGGTNMKGARRIEKYWSKRSNEEKRSREIAY